MATQKKKVESDEPVGIVISGGSREEQAPRFSAYVWGPVPDLERELAGDMVAA